MAGKPGTYSFLDTNASISGPGGAFSLAAGAGAAEEGISIVASEPVNNMQIGAGGDGVQTLVANKSGKITVRLLKTSPTNAMLSLMLALQRQSASSWGQNIISIANKVSGDVYACRGCAFSKVPDNQYAKIANVVEWEFDSTDIDPALGAGVA